MQLPQQDIGMIQSPIQTKPQEHSEEKKPFSSEKQGGVVNQPLDNAKWSSHKGNRFIELWQSIFNRRIFSFWSFALQVGDLLIMIIGLGYTAVCCVTMTDDKNSGSGAQFLMAGTVVLGCRNGLLSYIFGLSLERLLLWHQFFAWCTLVSSINHWCRSEGIVSGFFIEIVLILFILMSIKPIRRSLWELFMKVHWILIIILFVACIAHGVGVGIATLGYFALDVIFRIYQSFKYREMSFQLNIERIGNNLVKCSLKKGTIQYDGGQYFFMMIPSLTSFQWHPFSVFSSPHEDNIVIYVKVLGDWTQSLYKLAGEEGKPVVVKAYLDGPYGIHSVYIRSDKYKNFICVSGGIGVTPIISTAKELLNQKKEGRPINNFTFIWTGRDKEIVHKVMRGDELDSLLLSEEKSILHTFYHLSNSETSKDNQLQAIDVENQVKVISGRPQLSKYFEDAFKIAIEKGDPLIAVLACGPQSLIDSVEILAMKWSIKGVRFDVHQEIFDF